MRAAAGPLTGGTILSGAVLAIFALAVMQPASAPTRPPSQMTLLPVAGEEAPAEVHLGPATQIDENGVTVVLN